MSTLLCLAVMTLLYSVLLQFNYSKELRQQSNNLIMRKKNNNFRNSNFSNPSIPHQGTIMILTAPDV